MDGNIEMQADDPEISHDPDDDGGYALQDVRGEAAPVGQEPFSVLAEIDARQDADGDSDDRGDQDDQDAADQRIGDPAAGLTHRLRDIDEEMPVYLGDTGLDDI